MFGTLFEFHLIVFKFHGYNLHISSSWCNVLVAFGRSVKGTQCTFLHHCSISSTAFSPDGKGGYSHSSYAWQHPGTSYHISVFVVAFSSPNVVSLWDVLVGITISSWHHYFQLASLFPVGITFSSWHHYFQLASLFPVGTTISSRHHYFQLAPLFPVGITISSWHHYFQLASLFPVGITISSGGSINIPLTWVPYGQFEWIVTWSFVRWAVI